MRYVLRPAGRPAAMLAAGIMAVAALLTGCGTPGQGPGGSGPSGGAAPLARTRTSGPEWGSRAEALALARQLLSRLALPPGARAARMPVVPRLLRQPASSIAAIGLVDVHRLFSLPQRPPAVQRFLLTHAPASMRRYEHGEESSPAGTQMQDVSYEPRSVPGGIFRAQLVAAVVPGPGATSLLRARCRGGLVPPPHCGGAPRPGQLPQGDRLGQSLESEAEHGDQGDHLARRHSTAGRAAERAAGRPGAEHELSGDVDHLPGEVLRWRRPGAGDDRDRSRLPDRPDHR
jgi:hypothetical protein